MGRPVNKHKLTQLVAYTADGNFQVVKQVGAKKFLLSNGSIYKLTTNTEPNEGEMYLLAYLPSDEAVTVAKISNRKLTASDGNMYGWVTSDNKYTPDQGYVWVESWYWYND